MNEPELRTKSMYHIGCMGVHCSRKTCTEFFPVFNQGVKKC